MGPAIHNSLSSEPKHNKVFRKLLPYLQNTPTVLIIKNAINFYLDERILEYTLKNKPKKIETQEILFLLCTATIHVNDLRELEVKLLP